MILIDVHVIINGVVKVNEKLLLTLFISSEVILQEI